MPQNISLAIRMNSPSFPPWKLLIILYQLTKSEAISFNSFQNIFITSFSMSKFAKGNNSKNAKGYNSKK